MKNAGSGTGCFRRGAGPRLNCFPAKAVHNKKAPFLGENLGAIVTG